MAYKIALYLCVAACWYGTYMQIEFLWHYFEYQDNPVREENLEGAFLVGMLWVVAWGGRLALAILKKNTYSKLERTVGVVSGGLVVFNAALSVVLSYAI